MGRKIYLFSKEMKERWSKAMPKFFKVVTWVCGLVSGTALAVNTAIVAAGAEPHAWWVDIFPYLVGIPAGAMFACKFTVKGGIEADKECHQTILDKDDN